MASAVWKVSNVGRPRKANRAVYERPQKPAANLHAPALRSPLILVTPDDEEDDDRNCGLRASRSTPHFVFSTETTAESRKKSTRAQNSQTSLVPPSTAFEPPSSASTSDLLHGAFVENLGDEIPSSPVMGKNWKQMQEATFTNWVNERLKGKQSSYTGPRIQDLRNDLCDGLVLIRLMEVLTKKKITGYVKQPRITVHKMVNLDLALRFIADEGIKLIGIGSHNIFEGNLGLIMGLVWTLIQKYQIRMTSTRVSTKAVMIHWLQSILPEWKISNLNTDWNDGRCLMALIGEVKPGVGHDVRALDPTKRRKNCARALAIAANHLKIPQLIAPEDLSNPHIDDLSVMTYLSYYCEPAKQRLLKWVKRMIPQMRVTSFGADWVDGRAFGALIDACFPGLVPGWHQMEPGNTKENMAQILPLVKRSLGIDADFTAVELARGQVEELKVMTFINYVRHGILLSLPNEVAVSGPGLQKAVIGKETHFEIDTTQAGPGKLFIDAYYENGLKVTFTIRERVTGVITLTYTPEMCGVMNFDILWSDTPIPRSPFSVPVSDSQMIRIVDFEHHPRAVQVNQSLELFLDTRPAGTNGRLFAKLEYKQKGVESTEAQQMSFPDGTVKLSYKPTIPGKAVLRIFWNDEELPHLAVSYVVIDNMQYRIIAKPEEKVYHTFQHANFQVRSDNGQLNALTMTANYEDMQFPIAFSSIQGNIGHASFVPTFPGCYRIEVACVEKLIEGAPFTIEVADPSRCKLVGTLPKYLKLNSPYEFRVHTGDAGQGMLEVTCPDRAISRLFDTAVHKLASGDSQGVVVTPRQMGNYVLGITFFGGHIPSSPFQVTVVDPSQCCVSGEVFNRGKAVVGKPVQFQITRMGPERELKPQVKASGPSAKYVAEVSTGDDKVYFVRFTPWEIGTHEISITYGGFDVSRSPFRMGVQGFDSDICSATGSGLQEALSGIPAQFVILAKQTGLIDDGILVVNIRNVTQPVDCRVRIRDNKNGTYQVAYLVHLPGAYLISVLAAGAHIPGSPFRLTARPGPEPDKCSMWGPALQPNALLKIGKPIDFKVSAHGAGTGALVVKAVGPGGTQARVYLAKPEDRTGIYDVKLDPVRHGKYRLSVKWSGRHIPGSPHILKVYAGADPSKCRAHGPGLEDGVVERPSTFVIETRDAGAGTLKVRLHGVKNAFKIELKPKDQMDQRTLQARYNPRKPGDYLITIKWDEKNIPGN
ncbi:Filamin-C [Geodia barretti]|uniref:Filamin-C n=1 Tax=Geodia barretti TaxID=519541 RepID=A0AA35XL53_GEOBA|nr:Filamin-C [Geodia barretti]